MIKPLRSFLGRAARKILPASILPERRFETAAVFQEIHGQNLWKDGESVSGPGSTLQYTQELRLALPELIRRNGIKTMLDLPCGDFQWMQMLSLPIDRYIGADIVPALIEKNRNSFSGPAREFRVMDLTADSLPPVDLLFCRDCMIHLPYELIARAIANICRSQIKFALLTTYPFGVNSDIGIGNFFEINLRSAPFSLPPSAEEVKDWVPPFSQRVMGLWRVEDLRTHFAARPLRIGTVSFSGKN